jgi:hypothetical protein
MSSSAGRAFGVSKSKPPVTAILDRPTTLGDLKLAELNRFDSLFDLVRTIVGAAFELAFRPSCFRTWGLSSWLLRLLSSAISASAWRFDGTLV